MWTENDYNYMTYALKLAEKGLGSTWPNPMVGALVVKNKKIIGEGWHKKYGSAHAETIALKQAGALAKNAVVYVTLEPCAHYGNTPPCALALRNAGVKQVVVATEDPNPMVAGKGFEILRQAGIKTKSGLMQKEAAELNKVFLKKIKTGLPYVISKAALTLDGKIACHNGVSKWITSEPARKYAHYLRYLSDAVLVGSGTIREDDPKLNVRYKFKKNLKNPLPIIIEGRQMISKNCELVRNSGKQQLILATTRNKKKHLLKNVEGIEILTLPGVKRRVDIKALLEELGRMNINLLMIEGGGEIQASFFGLDEKKSINYVDELQWMIAPKIIGGTHAKSVVGGIGVDSPSTAVQFGEIVYKKLGDDYLMIAHPQ